MVAVTSIVMLTAAPKRLQGQELNEGRDARLQYGPLALAPSLRVTDVGLDSNPLGQTETRNPRSDFTATVSPAVDGWLRLPRVRVSGQSKLNFVYYNELSELRSVDTDSQARVDVLLKYVTPYVGVGFANTRHGRNYEIDAPVRRADERLFAGANVRLTGKSSIDFTAGQFRADYGTRNVSFESDLPHRLNRTSDGVGATLRYAVTPLTNVGVEVERFRDRFEFSPERDTNQLRVAPIVEFRPDAVISGRAGYGMYIRENVGRDGPESAARSC